VERSICPTAESIMTDSHFSMCMCKTVLFLLPVWNLTSQSYSSTLTSYMMWKFWWFANTVGRNWHIYIYVNFAWMFRSVTVYTDGCTHRQRQTEFIICPMQYAIAMEQTMTFMHNKNRLKCHYRYIYCCLQRFDTVGWAAGRASGL